MGNDGRAAARVAGHPRVLRSAQYGSHTAATARGRRSPSGGRILIRWLPGRGPPPRPTTMMGFVAVPDLPGRRSGLSKLRPCHGDLFRGLNPQPDRAGRNPQYFERNSVADVNGFPLFSCQYEHCWILPSWWLILRTASLTRLFRGDRWPWSPFSAARTSFIDAPNRSSQGQRVKTPKYRHQRHHPTTLDYTEISSYPIHEIRIAIAIPAFSGFS